MADLQSLNYEQLRAELHRTAMKSADDLDMYLEKRRDIAATGQRIKGQDIRCRTAECELAWMQDRLRHEEEKRALEEGKLGKLGKEKEALAAEDDALMKRCRECTDLLLQMEQEGKGGGDRSGLDVAGKDRSLEMV